MSRKIKATGTTELASQAETQSTSRTPVSRAAQRRSDQDAIIDGLLDDEWLQPETLDPFGADIELEARDVLAWFKQDMNHASTTIFAYVSQGV